MKLATFLPAALVILPMFAQTKAALDKAALEAYLRHAELWIPQVAVSIDDPKPSTYLPGFSEVAVRLSYNGQSKEEHYFVSPDGKNIVKGEAFDLTKSPFQAAIDKIQTDSQPSYGKAGAPVTIVVYGDFQCPLCKVEAQVMRKNLVQTFRTKCKCISRTFRSNRFIRGPAPHPTPAAAFTSRIPKLSGSITIGFTKTRKASRPRL
jgi:hypothetical protein